MAYYRLYFMSERNGHFQSFAEYEAPDDESAIALAAEADGEFARELWCGRRMVAEIERVDPASRMTATWQMGRETRAHATESES